MRFVRWLSIGILATAVLAGCSVGQQVTAEEIMDGLKQTRETTRAAHFLGEVVTSRTQEDGHFVLEAWMQKTDKTDALGKPIPQTRFQVLEASREELKGAVMVNNGETVWLYNPRQNKVITGKLQDLKQGRDGTQDPTTQMMRFEEQLQQILDGSEVEVLADNEQVAGRDAWKVKLTPKPETAQQLQLTNVVETTMWVGHERYVPLKAIVDASDLGKLEATMREFELDGDIDASLFTFTPPAGAEVIDAAALAEKARPTTTNLDEARKTTSFAVLAPASLPQGVRLEEVQKLGMGGEAVVQNYGGAIEFSLVQTRGDRGFHEGATPFGAKTSKVTVRGQEATLVTGTEQERGALLRWQENGVNIIIAGTLSAEQAQAIAESLQ